MTAPNNLNTDPLVLNDGNHFTNGNGNGKAHAQQTNGNRSASGTTVSEHAVNAKNSLVNCEVRDAPSWEFETPPGLPSCS